ncbi:MAG: prepilin-type N-terminal cleavage/methylation domain-containing protein [Verrucomicrobiae bacterium]|nr:prepilin-type N-terminal cleavage/methylation domain-containing protein [Verrucomicrobiae bacterium]
MNGAVLTQVAGRCALAPSDAARSPVGGSALSPVLRPPAARSGAAFTLVELLVVIAIMAVLAAITVPAFKNIRQEDAFVAASRQLLDDVAGARQYAIAQRTTVYMIFCPPGFWNDPAFPPPAAPQFARRTNLFEKQYVGYTFLTLRSVGDQPGRTSPRYLSDWRALPEGTFIPPWKFIPPTAYRRITDPSTGQFFDVYGFATNNIFPFPTDDTLPVGGRHVTLPYIAFNYLGQLTVDGVNPAGRDEFIPLARGAVLVARDSTKTPQAVVPTVEERPPGNSTNAFNLIRIDWLTGRARVERQRIGGT